MEVGDLVKQRSVGVAIISEFIRSSLNMGMIGVVKIVHNKTQYSYDGRNRGDITVVWSNGKEETLPEIYLEVVNDEQGT
tara:strand:- start:2539 stop:2775 length:237 start_codon:yes stop_codon:yes gene_type:complete